MRKANDESLDSPFLKTGFLKPSKSSRVIKRKLCGGISELTPTYFQLNHINILDSRTRSKDLFTGYKTLGKDDFKLISRPELQPQEKRIFDYEDFKSNQVDYSAMKPSNIIDLVADKRPQLKTCSNFYTKYNQELSRNGFRRKRGIFTVEGNQKYKYGKSSSTRFGDFKQYIKDLEVVQNNLNKGTLSNDIIREFASLNLPVSFKAGKNQMQRFLVGS